MPKVSVIIPIYNVEQYVRKCIESVLAQTERDIEIILVDDGSRDRSGLICNEYASQDSRVMVIHKENGGLSSARNVGTKVASSDYVIYLDGDDYLRQDAVERCLEIMKQYPSDFIQFLYEEVREGDKPTVNAPIGEIYQAHTSGELFENLYRLGGVAASAATKFMKRSLALKIPFENIRHEDEMWCTKAFQNDLTVTYIPDVLYYYVMRDGSIIHSSFNRKKLDNFIISETRIEVLQKFGYKDLLSQEYNKLFQIVLLLYREAKVAKDKEALQIIKIKFAHHKNKINETKGLSGRFALLYKLMCANYSFINLYYLYWIIKK